MRASQFIPGLLGSLIWVGGIAELIGMPIAWLRLRRTEGWKARPRNLRRIDLLAGFIRPAVELAMLWATLALGVGLAGVLLDWPGVTVGAIILLYAGPLLFVPWIVIEADVRRFPELAEEARRKREAKFEVRQPG